MRRSFGNLPNNQKIIIIGVRHNSEGIFIGLKEITVNNQAVALEYHKVETLDFKKLLDEIK